MRGWDARSELLFSYVNCERRIAKDHPLRAMLRIVDEPLAVLSPEFEGLYAQFGRPSIPPERLLRALLLQAFYSVRSERQLMEQLEYNLLFHAIARATEILRAAGAHDVWHEAPIIEGGWHLMGTARMGIDPARSVVSEWGRSHDVKNLFIVDGSIFVTSAGVNPTRTIQALALYIADCIKQRLATLFD
jgi:choline dehydrogenase-like flavoprotein